MVTSMSDLSTRRKAAGIGYTTTSTTLSSTEEKGWPSLGWANPVTTSLRDLAIYPSRKQRLHLQIKNEDLHAQPTRHYTNMKVPQTERADIIHTGTWKFIFVWLFFSCSDTICWTGQTSNNDLFPHIFFALGCVGPSSPKLEIQFSCISPWPCKNLHQHIVMLNCGFETTRICGAWAHLVHKLGTYYLEQLMALFGPISEPITIFNFMCINHFNIQLFNKIFYLVKSIEHNFTHRHLGIWVLLIQVVLIQNNVSLNYNFLFQEKTLSFQPFRLCM